MDMTSKKENKIEEEEDVYQISSGDEDCTRGMKSMDETKMITVSSIIS